MKRAFLFGFAVLGIALASTTTASANGRFPEANQLVFSPADPDLVLLRVTFGLLVSHDRGKTFEHVCELSLGTTQNEDPMYAVTPAKRIVGTTFEGLITSADEACSWGHATEGIRPSGKDEILIDLAASPNDANDIVTMSSAYDTQIDGQILFKSNVFETKNGADSFSLLSTLDPTLLAYTIDVTKSDPDRMYISVVRDPGKSPKGSLLVSKDHGAHWDEEVIPFINNEASPFIAAVDPNDAERVYIRTVAGPSDPHTRLLVREKGVDGGPGTFRTIHTSPGPLLGFALSADGGKVWVGGKEDHLWEANTTDFDFKQKTDKVEINCLLANEDGLWACAGESSGFVLGLSTDEGATFTPRLHFCDIRGELTCPADSTTVKQCGAGGPSGEIWPLQRINLGCEGDAGVLAPVDAGPTTPSGPAKSDDGCNCTVPASTPWGSIALGGIAGVVVLGIVRRRRNRS